MTTAADALAAKRFLVSKIGAQKAGVAVTFTLTSPGTPDPATGTFTSPTVTTWTGTATRIPGDPVRYETLGLVESESPSLAFTPDTFGDKPALESLVSFGGVTYSVRDVSPWAPTGTAISCRIIVSR